MNEQTTSMRVLSAIVMERDRQEQKWGRQDHDDGKWALILLEEVGEACKTSLAYSDPKEADFAPTAATRARLREELVQTAAVVVAWIEALDRRAP